MVNMGEIFAHTRIGTIPMDRVMVSDREARDYTLRPGDLLFARQSLVLAGAGRCSIFLGDSEDVTFESHLIRVRLRSDVAEPLFYYYFFSSPIGRRAIESIVEQVAAAGIRGSDLARLRVPQVDVNRQIAIARTPYVGLEHMPRQRVAIDSWGRSEDVTSGKSRYTEHDVLFGKLRPYFHKVAIAPLAGVCSTDILVIRPKFAHYLSFALMHLSSDAIIQHATACSTGTKMPRVSWGDLARFNIPVPPELVLCRYDELARPMLQKMIEGINESRTLTGLRDALLPKLLSGELRIRDAEKAVEAVV
jgi:restriction endonuclease S subunit